MSTSKKDAERTRKWQVANKERVKEVNRKWRETNRDRYFAMVSQNQKRLKKVTPKWANKKAMTDIYEQMFRLNREAGETKFNVDHIVPINGKEVCGLHCEANLRIILAVENSSKGRRLDCNLIEALSSRSGNTQTEVRA